jgi:hypothetical protein
MWPLLAITAVQGLYTAYGQDRAGRANRRVARYNALRAEEQAADAMARGVADEDRFRRTNAPIIGAQRAGYAAQGVEVNSGSAAAVQDATGAIIEEDASTIRLNAAREAWGFQSDARSLRMGGDIAYREGRNQSIGTLITTGANIYGQSRS